MSGYIEIILRYEDVNNIKVLDVNFFMWQMIWLSVLEDTFANHCQTLFVKSQVSI